MTVPNLTARRWLPTQQGLPAEALAKIWLRCREQEATAGQ